MAFTLKLVTILLAFHTCFAKKCSCKAVSGITELNNRPIIGVMMQSTNDSFNLTSPGENYIAASYIKYLESSGARVAPIWNNITREETKKIFKSINGVLFPGGDVDPVNSSYARVGQILFDLAKESNDLGDYFPVWGTCLGHEFLAVLVGKRSVLTHTNSMNITLKLKFENDSQTSKMFCSISPELKQFLSDIPSTANFHHYSVTMKSFDNSDEMKNFYKVLSTSFDLNGTEFISTMEGIKYPFFSTQWHPEKNSFEWTPKRNMSHVANAILSTQYMSNFFVNQARCNNHKFDSPEDEERALIYNYNPHYTGDTTYFEQMYFFQASSPEGSPTVDVEQDFHRPYHSQDFRDFINKLRFN